MARPLTQRACPGLYRHRVRILGSPLSDYERYACEWGYALNEPAGDDIRVIDLSERPVPPGMVDHDFWLINDELPVRMHYSAIGEFLGATVEPQQLTAYRVARDTAWAAGEPFAQWWVRHPEHRRANPVV